MRCLLFLLVPACASDANATLKELANLRLGVQSWTPSDTQPTPGFVTLGYDDAAFRATHGNQCAVLDHLDGTVDGMAMDEADLGGGVAPVDGDIDTGCGGPAMNFATTFSGPTTFTLTDGSATVTAVFDASAFASHVPTLVSPSSWTFHGGDAVDIAWSAPDDLAPAQFATDGPYAVILSTGKTENNNTMLLSPQVVGNDIELTVPSPLVFTGDAFLVFAFGYTGSNATTCTGATSCVSSTTRGYSQSVTLAN